MRTFLRNFAAIAIGLITGSIVNLALISIGATLIPPPAGADLSTYESLRQSIHLFDTRHFLFPFLAHAAGTLVGATCAALLASGHKLRYALAIGGLFLIGGAINVFMLPAPFWFNLADLLLAYLPMAWLGGRLGSRRPA